jgi:hypothetical protein
MTTGKSAPFLALKIVDSFQRVMGKIFPIENTFSKGSVEGSLPDRRTDQILSAYLLISDVNREF